MNSLFRFILENPYLAFLYLVPTIVATNRQMPNKGSTIVVNLFLGWTVIGWIIALAMALGRKDHPIKTETMTDEPLPPPLGGDAGQMLESDPIGSVPPRNILNSSREPREAKSWYRSARYLVGISLLVAVAIGIAIGTFAFLRNRPAATFTYVTEEGSIFGASREYPEENDLLLAAVAPEKASSSKGWAISGSVTNNSPKSSDYMIEITVRCGVNVEVVGSGQIVATAEFEFERVRPGRSESITFDIAKSVFGSCVVNTSIIRDAHYGF
jgi:hypothetical protein